MSNMTTNNKTRTITIAGLLTALGILIPLIMPIKIIIGPASYTLGSHIPVNMAMFASPLIAAVVSVGTTIGFLAAGFPIVIVLRALSHIVYASLGAFFLQRQATLPNVGSRTIFNLVINLIHGAAEVAVVYALTAAGLNPVSENYLFVLIVLVGIGTVIHGMIDFELSYQFTRALDNRARIKFATTEL